VRFERDDLDGGRLLMGSMSMIIEFMMSSANAASVACRCPLCPLRILRSLRPLSRDRSGGRIEVID